MYSVSPQLAASTCAIPLAFCAWLLWNQHLEAQATRKETILNEIRDIGKTRPDSKRIKGTAVIVGGSVAGLWTARVAADHFEDVLVIESEAWVGADAGKANAYDVDGVQINGQGEQVRSRIPQYTAVHGFQPIQLTVLRKYFPNVDQEIKGMDGRINDYDVNLHAFGQQILRLPKHDQKLRKLGLECFFMSRDAYERLLRRLVLNSTKRIRWLTATATGASTVPEEPSILDRVSVRLPDGTKQDIPASLVIDCSGDTQVGLKWIQRISSEPENEERLQKNAPPSAVPWEHLRADYDCDQRFVCYRFFVPAEIRSTLPIPGGYDNNPFPFAYVPIAGVQQKLLSINRIEGHRLNIFFCGWGNPELPMNFDEIFDWLKSFEREQNQIPAWIYNLLEVLLKYKNQCEVSTDKYPEQFWLHYEAAPFIPSNFVAIGDSVMRVNPTFGQGCSKAAIGALTLDGMLRKQPCSEMTSIPSGFGRDFARIHNEKIQGIWFGTKPTDYMWDTTRPVAGENLIDDRAIGAFGNMLMEMATKDDELDKALFKVRLFMAPSTILMTWHLRFKYTIFAFRKKYGWI